MTPVGLSAGRRGVLQRLQRLQWLTRVTAVYISIHAPCRLNNDQCVGPPPASSCTPRTGCPNLCLYSEMSFKMLLVGYGQQVESARSDARCVEIVRSTEWASRPCLCALFMYQWDKVLGKKNMKKVGPPSRGVA